MATCLCSHGPGSPWLPRSTEAGIGAGALSLGKGALRGQNRLSITSKHYDPRAAYAVAFPFAVGAMSLLYQYLKTGKEPEELRDLVWPKTGGQQPGVGKSVLCYPGITKTSRLTGHIRSEK
jgi:hypothetical protein